MNPRAFARPTVALLLLLLMALAGPSPVHARMGGTVSNGYEFSVIIRPGTGLLGTGANSWSNTLGIGATTANYSTYQLISSSPDWSYVDAGMYYCLALKTDGTLWGWGRGSGFVFGNNSEANLWLPTQIGTERWIKVVAGVQTPGGPYITASFGIRSDSTLWAWGNNSHGQLGDGSTNLRSTPVRIGAGKWLDIHMNKYFTLGIQADSTLWGWGYNQFSVLGNPSIGNPTSPTKIGTDRWLQVCTGGAWSHGIKADSTLWGWGAHGGNGQTGLGSTSGEQTTPAQMGGGKWLRVVAGGNGSLGMKSDSTLWRWGTSPGGASNASTPTQVGSSKWRDFDIGFTGAVGVDAAGNYYGWGTGSGEVGDGAYAQRSGPTAVTAFKAEQAAPAFPALADKIAGDAGYAPSATSGTGAPITFASSNNAIAYTSPALIHPVGAGTVDIIAIAAEDATHYSAYAMRSLNVARGPQTLTFNAMADRTLLDADFIPATSSAGLTVAFASSDTSVVAIVNGKIHPVAAGTATITASQAGNSDYFPAVDIVRTLAIVNPPDHPHQDRKVAGSNGASFAIPGFGGLYGAGNNGGYLLGVGDQVNRNRFTLISPGNWRHVDAGGTYALALKADSTLWGWGTQPYGFGDGDTLHVTPAQIGTDRWIKVTAGLSTYANFGIKADSSLWAWGDNDQSVHGDGTTADKDAPARIGAGKWLDIAQSSTHAVGLMADYTLWTWGSGVDGRLGNGTTSGTVSAPARIGADRWLRVAAGNGTAFAIRSDSTLWGWGVNTFSSTGSWSSWGSTNVPTQISWGAKWIWIDAGNLATVAMKADSTLWTWGNNANGMIAQGSSSYTSYPSQVGSLKWRQIAEGMTGGLGLAQSGAFYGWGLNTSGAVGDSSNTDRTTPALAKFGMTQTLSFPALPAKTFGNADFPPGAAASSGLPVSYASSDTTVATFLNGLIHIVRPGTATITASQPGNQDYPAAANIAQTLTVGKAAQAIAFAAPSSRNIGDADFPLGATATSGLAVSYTSSNAAVATMIGGQVHIVGAGTTTLTASQIGNGNFHAAGDTSHVLTVSKLPQTIAFAALSAMTYGNPPFALGGSAGSNLAVSYASSDTSVATVSGSTVTIAGAGSADITASQAGDDSFSPAANVTQTLTVSKSAQVLTFAALAAKTFGDADHSPGATASSGLPVGYASSNPSVATIVSGQIHIVGWGTTNITASQAGNDDFNAAVDSVKPLTVAPRAQTISFPPLAAKTIGDPDFFPGAAASSGLAVSYASSNTSVAAIVSGQIRIVGAGAADITASQAGGSNYAAAANAVQRLTINKAPQSLTFGALAAGTYGDPDLTPVATASSGLAASYASSDTSVAAIVAGKIRIVRPGTATITASQPGDSHWAAAAAAGQTLTVAKRAQVVSLPAFAAKVYGNDEFDPGATSNSGLAVSYASSNTAVAQIISGKVHIRGAGTATIIASSAGNAYYLADDSAQILTVGKAAQKITFNEPPELRVGGSAYTPVGTANSGLPLTITISDATVAVMISGVVHPVGAGTTPITASQSGNANYLAAPIAWHALIVRKGQQSIAFEPLSARTFGDSAFALTGSAGSGLAIAYSSSNTSVATVSGSTVTLVGAGSADITANQPGNASWFAATAVSRTLTVNKAAQSITFAPLTPKAIGDPAFVLAATAGSGLPVTYVGSNPAVAAVSGSTVTIIGAGTANITASQPGNGNYLAAANVVRALAIVMANQTISFPALSGKTMGDADIAPGAAATSGLSIAYASSDTTVARIVSGQIRIAGAGSALITASQAGDAYYTPAPAVVRTFTVAKAAQAITFASPAAKTFGDSAFALTGSAGSGLAVAYSSSNTSVASVSGSTVTIVGAGLAVITASQAGNGNYVAAAPVARTLTIAKAAQTISFSAPSPKAFGNPDFTLNGAASSGAMVVFSSSNPSVASVAGNTVHIVAAGSAIITARQTGNANYDSAASVSHGLTVASGGQTITFPAVAARTFGDAGFALGASASSGLAVTYESSNPSVASISGDTVRILGAGTAILVARQSGDADHDSAAPVPQTLIVGKAAQTLAFHSLASRTFGEPDFALTASSSSGLGAAYASSDSAVATVSGATVHIVGAGTATITASQPGNAAFLPAPDSARTLVVAKAAQSITLPALAAKTYGDPDFILTAAAGSGLTPEYAIADTLVARIVAGKIRLTGQGVTEITWTQGGGPNHLPAPAAVQTLTVARAAQDLAFDLGSDTLRTVGDAPFALLSVSTSGLSPVFSSSDPEVVAVNGASASILKAGTAILTANQTGSAQYAPAAPINRSIRVRVAAPAPILAAEMHPAAGAVIDTSVVLSWSSKPEATAYRVIVSVDTLLSATLADAVMQDTALALGNLAFGSRIFWRVSALNATGASAFPPFLSHTVRPLPPAPIDIAGIPAFPEAGVGTEVEISWPGMAGSTGYHVQVSEDTLLAPRIDTVAANPALALTDLPIGGTQYWRVAPVNGVSEAPFTPWLSFKVKDTHVRTVTRSAVLQPATTPEPVQVSALVGMLSNDSSMSDVKITLTEEKLAPANLPAGFAALTGKIELNAVSGADNVGDNQISITLTLPDTLLNGEKVTAADEPMVYLVDSATGELSVLFDLKKDSQGRIMLPLSQGKGFMLAVDNVPPVVSNATPDEIRLSGSSPVISGTVSDNIRNTRAWLRFRKGGDENFDSVAVTVDAQGHFEMPLALKLDGSGFEYNVAASDGRNLETTASLDLPVTLEALQAADSLPSLQWRLFALPTIADESQLSGMTAALGVYGRDWRLFERAPEGMKEFGPDLITAEPGAAYWLKSRSSGFRPAITGGIAAPISKPFAIVLPPRSWRSFGNPFLFPVSWQSVVDSSQAAPGALVGPYTFRDSSWVSPLEVPALEPWEGYYAYNPTSDTVHLRIPSIRARSDVAALAKAAFHLQWQVRGPDGKDAGNYLGALPPQGPRAKAVGEAAGEAAGGAAAKVSGSAPGSFAWNVPKPENPGAGLHVGFAGTEKGLGLLQSDFREIPAEGGSMWTARLEGLREGQRYSSRLLGLDRLPDGMAVGLADSVTGHFAIWSSDMNYLVEAREGESARDLQVFVGSPEYVGARGRDFSAAYPSVLALGNFPNPAHDFTMIRYSVPPSASTAVPNVILTVYDMQGRRIKRLVDSQIGVGRHTIRWDIRDDKGRRVAAGNYRLLLEAGGKRMNRALVIRL